MSVLRSLSVLVLLVLGAALPRPAAAQASPFEVVVPVADVSEGVRNEAFATALGQVLARAAGGQDLRAAAGYAEALGDAGQMVQKFQYQRAGSGLALDVAFDPGAVRRVAARLGAPTGAGRPPVLLLVRDADGDFLDQAALAALAAAAGARGVDVTVPAAGEAPDPGQVVAADPVTLGEINRRYHTGVVLVGELGGATPDWTLVSGGQVQHWSQAAGRREVALAGAGNALADRLGRALNVIGAGPSDGKLWVSGLASAGDYAHLLVLLQADPAVSQVQALAADGDGILFSLRSTLPLPALARNLAAGGRVLVDGAGHAGADASLRWLH